MKRKIITSIITVIILMISAGLAARFLLAPMLDTVSVMDLLPDGGTENSNGDDNTERIGESETDDEHSESKENAELTETSNTEDESEPERGEASDSKNQEAPKSEAKENNPEGGSDRGEADNGSTGGTENSGSIGSSVENGDNGNADTSGSSGGDSGESAQSRIMNKASDSEIAQGSAILAKIDAGKFFSLMETDKAAAKQYLYSCLSPSEINTAMELYSKYGNLLN